MNKKHMPCAYWREGEICAKGTEPGYTDFCVLGPCSQMKPSNADKIREMSDEKLADELLDWFMAFYAVEWSRDEVLNWLKQEAEDDG